jgi:ABC-type transporter MlaC component
MEMRPTIILLIMLFSLISKDAVAGGLGVSSKTTVQEIFTLFSGWSATSKSKQIFEEAATKIDYQGMAEAALKPTQWEQMTALEKKEYTSTFRQLVEDRYYQRWHKLFQRSQLIFVSETKKNNETLVKTVLNHGKDDGDTVVWRLRGTAGQSRVISLDVNGRDLLVRLSDRFQKQFERKGAIGLIVWIKAKSKSEDSDLAMPTGGLAAAPITKQSTFTSGTASPR